MVDAPMWLPSADSAARGGEMLDRIVAAGRTTFRSYGYERTRVDDIVEAAGVSHGTFYLYFHNKEDLLHRMAVECAVRLQSVTSALVALPRPIEAVAFRGWIESFVAAYREDGAVIRVWLDNRDDHPLMRALANDTLVPLTQALAAVVDPAAARDIGPDYAGFGMLSLLERLSSYFVDTDPGAIAETAARLMFAATIASEPTPS